MFFTKVSELMTKIYKQMLEELRPSINEQSNDTSGYPIKTDNIIRKDTQ